MRFLLPVLGFLVFGLSVRGDEIPFDFVDGYILVHASVDAHPVTLVLDSGASACVMSLDTARRLNLPLGDAEPVDGVEAGATAYNMQPVTAQAGGIRLGEFALASDLHNATQLCSESVDGLVGADFFKGRVTQIDYAAHKLRLLAKPPAGGESLPLKARNGIYCLPVSVNGSRPRWTRLDTGCNDALHWVVPRSDEPEGARGLSIGFITNTEDETLVTVGLGRIILSDVEAALHGEAIFPGEAGLLGSEILSQYRVTIDGRRGRIYFVPAAR